MLPPPIVVDWDSNTPVVACTLIALLSAPWTVASILSCVGSCVGGSFTASIEVNDQQVAGLSAVAVGPETPAVIPPTSQPLPKGASVTVVITNVVDTPVNAAIQINLQTSLN